MTGGTAARTAAALLLGLCLMLVRPGSAAAQIDRTVELAVGPSANAVVLGESFDVTIAITNHGTDPTPPLVIHIDITDPDSEHSVDPEDWTSTLSRTIGVVEPGRSSSLTWQLQPISPGNYTVYAVALSAGIDDATISNVATVAVADQRSLNAGGILPVALGVPALTGALLAYQVRRNRRSR